MSDATLAARWTRSENLLLLFFLAVLAWAPFPYGSNRTWAELMLGIGLGSVLFAWAGAALTGFATVSSLTRRLLAPALCVAIAMGWAGIQAIDLTSVQQATGLPFTNLAHGVWTMAAHSLGREIGSYISVDPEKTRQALFAASLSIASFLLAFNLSRDRERAAVLFNGLIAITLIYAVMAVAVYHFQLDLQSWLMPDARADLGRLSGPFVNPNHFATFMALGTLAALGTFVESVRQTVVWDRGRRILIRSALHALSGINAMRMAAIIFMLSALLFTQSRAAVVALIVGIFALALH